MNNLQFYIVSVYTLVALICFIVGLVKCSHGHAFERNIFLNIIGAFVWGDTVIFGLFWSIVGIVMIMLFNWHLFIITLLLFWLLRAIGEMIYWLNQQFSTINRNPPRKLWFYALFKNDSVWFVYQIFWQCVAVVCLVLLYVLWHN